MNKVKCPVCGKHEFEEDFELCPVCEWQHDRVQEDEPDFQGGANRTSLSEFKALWKQRKGAVVKGLMT